MLQKNPIKDNGCVKFMKEKFKAILDAHQAAEQEKKANTDRLQWYGIDPYLRLIHCLIDDDDIIGLFKDSFRSWNRSELDNRKN